MTNKELRKLNRTELLEVLVTQSKEIDRLKGQLEQAQQALESRKITADEAGSIAMASLQLNGVFESAQKAVDLYVTNVEQKMLSCEKMEQETNEKCSKMLRDAQDAAKRYLSEINTKLLKMSVDNGELRSLLSTIDPPTL